MTRQIPRAQAIDALRTAFTRRLDPETSMCKYAAEHGIFCGGFERFGNGELRSRFRWINDKERAMPREKLEDLANRWQLARQEVGGQPIACDVQQREHDSCNGWDDFSNDDLAKFYAEVFKLQVAVA